MVKAFVPLLMLSLLPLLSSGFRFYGGEGGHGGPDFLGEAGLNAIPRLGRRSNPFGGGSNRFRFRFNGLGGPDSFRFQGGDNNDNMMNLRKRMMEQAMASDNSKQERKRAAAMSSLAAPSGIPEAVIEEEAEEVTEDLEALSFADKYWKEFLNDIARKNVLEKLSKFEAEAKQAENDSNAPLAKAYGTPLQNYLARSMSKVKAQAAATAANSVGKDSAAKFDNFRPFVRANFRK